MPEIIQMPVLTKDQLLEANLEAVAKDYSAYCWHDTLRHALFEGNRHPVTAATLDAQGNFVCSILIAPNELIMLALTKARFNALATVPVDVAVLDAMSEAAENTLN